jgi:hypothetical protein
VDGSVGLVVADGSVVVVPLFGLIVSLVEGEVRSVRLLDESVVVDDGSVLDCGSADWVVEGVVDWPPALWAIAAPGRTRAAAAISIKGFMGYLLCFFP